MKPLAFCLLLILAATNIGYSQASVHKLDINSATLFLTAAEVVSTARISVSKGDNEISFTNVAGNINVESIMVSATNGVSVTGITFQNNYLVAENISPKAQELKDSIELMENAKQPMNTKITVLNEQIAILQSNKKVTGDHTGLSVEELQKMLDLVNSKMEGYINEKYKLEQQIKKINDRIARLKSQLDAEQQKGYQPGGKITVKLYAKESTNSSFTVSYITPNAGWTPSYDLWADDTYQPITLYYKAKVHQNCGVDWNNIRLKLSTGNPQEGMNPPTISAWYLEIQKQVVAYKRKSGKNSMTIPYFLKKETDCI